MLNRDARGVRALHGLLVLTGLLVVTGSGPGAVAGARKIPLSGSGVYVADISFFAAYPEEADDGKSMLIRSGDLETISWLPGTLPVVDAHVLMVNSAGSPANRLKLQVTLYVGVASMRALPAEADIRPGHEAIQEAILYERTYSLEPLKPATMDRISVPGIQLGSAVADLMRQGSWPSYVRAEARLLPLPPGVESPKPHAEGFLKVIARDIQP